MNIFLETYGCQMNVADSELVRAILVKSGHNLAKSVDDAEVILINACAIRENAYRKIYGRLDAFRPLQRKMKQDQRPFIVGILGCMAQNMKATLFRHPVVNLIVGPDNYRALPSLINKAALPQQGKRKPLEIEANLSEEETYSGITPARFDGVNAWVTVMRGCDNFCTFCVVPYTRGRERSRSKEEIIEEVHDLARQGFKQVTLLGQNVNSYRTDGAAFADLLLAAAEVQGIERVRFTSPHPKDFPEPLLEAIASHPKICKHIHLPLQSGSDRILKLMDRTYTQDEFIRLVEKIRAVIPGVSLTTDLITGFPSETDLDHQETIAAMEAARFNSAYIFKYSERKGTIAARKYSDDVSPEVKTKRIVQLFDLQHEIALELNREKIGQTMTVLIEGESDKRPGIQIGKTDGNMTVMFSETGLAPGEMIQIEMTEASPSVLTGRNLDLTVLSF